MDSEHFSPWLNWISLLSGMETWWNSRLYAFHVYIIPDNWSNTLLYSNPLQNPSRRNYFCSLSYPSSYINSPMLGQHYHVKHSLFSRSSLLRAKPSCENSTFRSFLPPQSFWWWGNGFDKKWTYKVLLLKETQLKPLIHHYIH